MYGVYYSRDKNNVFNELQILTRDFIEKEGNNYTIKKANFDNPYIYGYLYDKKKKRGDYKIISFKELKESYIYLGDNPSTSFLDLMSTFLLNFINGGK